MLNYQINQNSYQVDVVCFWLEDAVGRDDQVIAGQGAGLEVTASLGSFVEEHPEMHKVSRFIR